jgi:hypothetical protein
MIHLLAELLGNQKHLILHVPECRHGWVVGYHFPTLGILFRQRGSSSINLLVVGPFFYQLSIIFFKFYNLFLIAYLFWGGFVL